MIEWASFSRFLIVGAAATATHMLAALLLLALLPVHALLSNLAAFLLAFGVSFLGHSLWTFRCRDNMARRLWRFLLLAIAGLAGNSLVLALLLEALLLPAGLAVVLAVGVMPLITYIVGRHWVFVVADRGDDLPRSGTSEGPRAGAG